MFKLTLKTPERRHWRRRSGVFIINFKHISNFFLVFLLLTLNMYLLAGTDWETYDFKMAPEGTLKRF